MSSRKSLLPVVRIEESILLIRDQKVMLDSTLADLYGVGTKALVQAMKRNSDRFPADFVFQLDKTEFESLRSQNVTSSGHGGRRYLPYAFTEHGAIMLASVLNSGRAIEASIYVVRAFVRLRSLQVTYKEIAEKLAQLERKVTGHDADIKALFSAIRQLMAPPTPAKRRIGFR